MEKKKEEQQIKYKELVQWCAKCIQFSNPAMHNIDWNNPPQNCLEALEFIINRHNQLVDVCESFNESAKQICELTGHLGQKFKETLKTFQKEEMQSNPKMVRASRELFIHPLREFLSNHTSLLPLLKQSKAFLSEFDSLLSLFRSFSEQNLVQFEKDRNSYNSFSCFFFFVLTVLK